METIKLEDATLTNLAEGELEAKFQDRLKELVPIFADPRDFVKTGEGKLIATIELSAVLELDCNSGTVVVNVGAELKRPKRLMSSRAIYRRGAVWLVGNEPKQQPLAIFPRPAAVEEGEAK